MRGHAGRALNDLRMRPARSRRIGVLIDPAAGTLPLVLHHGVELLPTQVEALPVPRQLAEVPAPIERLGRLVDAVEDDRHDREDAARQVTIHERLREQAVPETQTSVTHVHAEPGQHRHRKIPAGQVSAELRRQVGEAERRARVALAKGLETVAVRETPDEATELARIK